MGSGIWRARQGRIKARSLGVGRKMKVVGVRWKQGVGWEEGVRERSGRGNVFL